MEPRHILVLFHSGEGFGRAFDLALSLASRNRSQVTVLNVVRYPLGLGLDPAVAVDMLSHAHSSMQFDMALQPMEERARLAGVEIDKAVLDLELSAATAVARFAGENGVDLMLIGGPDAEEISDLRPPCAVIIVD